MVRGVRYISDSLMWPHSARGSGSRSSGCLAPESPIGRAHAAAGYPAISCDAQIESG